MPQLLISVIVGLLLLTEVRSEPLNSRRWLEIEMEPLFPHEGNVALKITLSDSQIGFFRSTSKSTDGFVMPGEPDEKCLTLDAARADRLWAAIEQLRIFDWHTSYSPEDVGANISDGSSWSVSVKLEGKWMTSRGANTYPLLAPIGEPTVDYTMDNGVRKIFELLEPFEAAATKPSMP